MEGAASISSATGATVYDRLGARPVVNCRGVYSELGGAIIDPFLKREHQYATPYFAYAVGTLTAAGRARDLLPSGVKAIAKCNGSIGVFR